MNTMGKLSCLILAIILTAVLSACGSQEPGPASSGSSSVESAESSASGNDVSEPTVSEGEPSPGGTTTASSKADASKPKTETPPNTTTNAAPTNLTRDQVIAAMPADLKGATINYFMFTDPKNTSQKDIVAAFEKKTGVTLKTEIANKAQYASQLASKIAAGKSPDMVMSCENHPGWVQNLQPITNTGFNFNDPAWDADLMKNFTFNGRAYAANLKNTPIRNFGVIYYNKKALKKAEMEKEDPYTIWKNNPKDWTWDKLWSMCDEFLKANKNREGYYGITFGLTSAYTSCFDASFYRYDPAKGQYVFTMDSPEVVKRYEILIDAIGKKYATKADDSTAFTMGYTLFNWSYSSAAEKVHDAFSTIRKDLGVVPVPSDSTCQPLFEYVAYSVPVGDMTKGKRAVPYFIRYVMDAGSYNMREFYMNAQAKDVMDAALKQGNFRIGFGLDYDIWHTLIAGTSAQVKPTLSSFYGRIEDICKANNNLIKNYPK